MKLYSFTPVKNEEDIIESFVRYNMNILDGMVIFDNSSTDNTLKILYKLKDEGLNIDILEDKNPYFNDKETKQELLEYTIRKYNPDFIFPLDADEFISSNGTNPRKIIEQLSTDTIYLYSWKTYVMTKSDNANEKFVPKRILHQRNIDTFNKCIIPKETFEKGISIDTGGHDAFVNDNSGIEKETIDSLFLAHYPVRSEKQIRNKVICGCLNNSSIHSREEGLFYHQYAILDQVIKDGKISEQQVLENSKKYCLPLDNKKQVVIKKKPINLDFCDNIKIKYSKISDTNDLGLLIKVSEAIIDKLRNENAKKDVEIENLKNEYEKFKFNYEITINSKTWRLRNKIVKLFGKR